MNTDKITGKYLMVLIAMCGLAGSAVGMVINCAGVFFNPIAEQFAVGKGAVSLTLTISTIAAAVAGLFLPKLLNDQSKKLLMWIGSMMMVGGTLALSLGNSVMFLYLMNAIRGFGSGLIHFVTITLFLNNWFFAKHGFVTSIAMGFSGIVGAVFSPILAAVISSLNWQMGYIVMGIAMIVFLLPILFLPITFTPEASGLKPLGYEEMTKGTTVVKENGQKTSPAYAFVLSIVMAMMINFVIGFLSHLPSYAVSLGYSAELGSLLLSVALVFNIGSKILVGTLSDKIGSRNAILVIAGLDIVSLILLLGNLGQLSIYAGSFLFGGGFGIAAVGVAMMAKSLFSIEEFGRRYSLISFMGTVTNAFAATIIGFLFDLTGSYRLIMVVDIALLLVVIICVILAFKKPKKV